MDIDQILGFNIYYPIVGVIEPRKKFQFYKVNGTGVVKQGAAFATKESFGIPSTPEYYISELKLVTTNGQKYRDVVDNAVKAIGGKFEQAFKGFKGAFDAVAKAKESVGLYSTSGEATDADQAITDMVAYKEALKGVFDKLAELAGDNAASAQARGYEAPTDTSKLAENKQKKFQALDKMIEELMLEHLQGDTDDNN